MIMTRGKGSSFEREICRLLSLWWSYDKRDDIFWRTSGSGARAKTRSKKGISTFGQYGDIQATDPLGQHLIDVCSIELKRGYSQVSFANLIDKPEGAAEQLYEKFILQAITDNRNSNSLTWMLIVKRDRRETIVLIPFNFYKALKRLNPSIGKTPPCFLLNCFFKDESNHKMFGTTLSVFFRTIRPSLIKRIRDIMKTKIDYKKEERKSKLDLDKEAQVYRCTNCDEYEVRWNGKVWLCNSCGLKNDIP